VNVTIKQLIGHGHFFQKTLLNVDTFIRYCKERSIEVSQEKLERLEELGVFLPMLRIRWPKIKIKIVAREDGEGYEELGMLQEVEEWSGEVREENGGFLWWNTDAVQSLVDEGFLWMPTRERFQPWASYKNEDGWWDVESYYSTFQTLPLFKFIESTTLTIGLDRIASWSKEDALKWFETWEPHAGGIISVFQDGESAFDIAAKLCQILSGRYLPYAQSDGATITVPHPDFFDWDKFTQQWNAKEFLEEVGVLAELIADRWQTVRIQARHVDPLDSWRDFVEYFRRSQKDRLKGKALLAQTWWTMEKILNLFHEDLVGQKQYEFEAAPEDRELFYGEGVSKNELRFLELLANQYGVNPRPKLLLVVEGDGEEEQFPRLSEKLLPPSFPKLRIDVTNLKGGGHGEFKKLERLIDYYHLQQTIVFVVLDRENRANDWKKRVTSTTASKWNPKRTITKEEYIHLWEKTVEFDNFTDNEIANGMTKTSNDRYQFSPGELATCRQRFGKGRDPLDELYKDKLDEGLPKTRLLRILFDNAIIKPKMEINGEERPRPIIDVILKVQRLALRNHQPSHLDAWQQTQASDWLGNLIK
jgi:hypothetical protein